MAKEELKSEHFFRLYTAAQKRIYAYLLIMVHNHSDAEDLHQETASILWERFDEFDPGKSFAAWAIGIARNKALDFLKSKQTSRPLFSHKFYNDISRIAALESADTDKRLKALRDCMKKMSLQNQQLIHLRFEKGNSVKKISQMSAYSADAVYKKLSRIYAVLQNCINQILIQWERT